MSLVPSFQIGIWNVWILPLLVFVTMFTPNLFLSEEQITEVVEEISEFATSGK